MIDEVFDSFEVQYTKHGELRVAQRKIGRRGVKAALLFGRERRSKGALVYRLDRRRLRRLKRLGRELRRHEGTTVVMSAEDRVVTAYRSSRSRKNIR